MRDRPEPVRGIEPVGIPGDEIPVAESMQAGMAQRAGHQGRSKATPTMLLQHIDVADVAKGREVGYKSGEANLAAFGGIGSQTQGISEKAGDGFEGNGLRPIGFGQVGMNRLELQPIRIV